MRILIPSGAGAPGFGGIVSCLRKAFPEVFILAGDAQEFSYGKKLANQFISMPSSSEKNYIHKIFSVIKDNAVSVVLPITTGELDTLSQYQREIQQLGAGIAISGVGQIKTLNNKHSFYQFLQERNIETPRFAEVKSKAEFLHVVQENWPDKNGFICKPSCGNGGRGFRIFADINMVQKNYFTGKLSNVYTTVSAFEQEAPDNFEQPILLSEYLPGREYTVDALFRHGVLLGMCIRSRDKVVSGISVSGSFVKNASIEETIENISKSMELHGPIGFQFKENWQGKPLMLECNPRLQGASSTAVFAGINLPALAVKIAMDQEITRFESPDGISFSRYWTDVQM